MSSERNRTAIAIVGGLAAFAFVVALGWLILRGPVAESGWQMAVAGPYKFVVAATAVGSVVAGLWTMFKVYRRLERGSAPE